MNSVFDGEQIKRRVASGVVMLGARRVLIQIILTGSNIILARLFAPEIFGTFAIFSFLILNLGELTNFGLIPALIQKKKKVTDEELQVIFTTVVVASLIFSLIIFFLAPYARLLYGPILSWQNIFWLRLFSLNLVMLNLTSVSVAILERNLQFKRLVVGQVSVTIIIKLLTVIFALKGFGLGSFVLGTLIGRFSGFILFYLLAPWAIGFKFSMNSLKRFLPFGLNVQANKLTGVLNGAVIPGFVGVVSGSEAVGLLNWATGLRQAGLAPYEVFEQLAFSAGSRVRENKKLMERLVERLLQLSSMATFPLLSILFAVAPSLIVIVYTSRWLPGLTALYLSIIQAVFILLGGVFMQVLLAFGKARTVRNITIFWTVITWLLAVPLVLLWNFNGVIVAGLIVSMTFVIPMKQVRKLIDIRVYQFVVPYLIYSVVVGLALLLLQRVFVIDSFIRLIIIGLTGLGLYVFLIMLFEGRRVLKDFTRFRKLVLG